MEENVLDSKCELLIIGGSAGSLDVLLHIMPEIDSAISFPIILVLHRRNTTDNTLTDLLCAKTKMQVKEADEKDILNPGTVYIAPPDYHLLIEKNRTLSLDFSEKVHYSRPSIDVTMQSGADVFGEKTVCILLSGANADGVEGLSAVKGKGGIIVAQNPETAEVSYMPQQAISNLNIDKVLKIEEMAEFINTL